MSKMSELSQVLDEMIACGEGMIKTANALKDIFSSTEEASAKSDTVTVNKIKAAIAAAYEEGQSKLKGNGKTVPALSVLKTPLRDGDLERPDDPAYSDAYFINANSATAPGIVDADRQPILERSEVYSGVYGRASINLCFSVFLIANHHVERLVNF